MKNYSFSFITPTHNDIFIDELAKSILNSKGEFDWEWIILVNGNNTEYIFNRLKKDYGNNPRVKIHKAPEESSKVGYLKNYAFSHLASNEILIEMDHDDIITPDCLFELNLAFQDPEIGFAYSDNAKYEMREKKFIPYGKYYGWNGFYNYKHGDLNLPVMKSFQPDAASMAFIFYMPDHVRAWRSTVYHKLGGHNVDMSVLDDQDLIARTYLETKFKYIEKCLYIYRITGNNTWIERNDAIQANTKIIFNKYAQLLAERDAELKELLKIDLGGGIDKRKGYTSIDLYDGDIKADLNEIYPLEDNSVGVINASHFIEHIENKQHTMSEIYRVLCDGGWAFIDVPSTDGRGAWMDPTHVSFWNENSFLYYTNKEQARYIRNDSIRFQAFRLETIYPTKWWEDKNIPVVRTYLRAIKSNKRRPDPILI